MPPHLLLVYLQAADSVEVARAAPFVEKLVADGYEVLYLTEAIDEAVVTNLAKFGDHELVDVSKEGVQLDDEEAQKKVSWMLFHCCLSRYSGLLCVEQWILFAAAAGSVQVVHDSVSLCIHGNASLEPLMCWSLAACHWPAAAQLHDPQNLE